MNRVGFVTNANHAAHAVAEHPETPERLDALLRMVDESGLARRLVPIDAHDASDEALAVVHPQAYLDALRQACSSGGGWVDPDTYITPGSCDSAWLAAGACIAATDAVLFGEVRSAFCAVRPPGHHARPAQAMGFCLLNNVAVAARYAQRSGVGRVAILDIDVHHGNGTQDAFYDDGSVLYVSTHQFPFYPGTGRAAETGRGEGAGANVNIPLPARCGDEQYRAVFEQIVEPVVRRFKPEILFVSCGFDAHFLDPIAMMSLSVDGYGELTQRIVALADDLCDGRVVVVLEGGYDLDAIAAGARRVIEVLLGESITPDAIGPSPYASPDIDGLLGENRELREV
jgi:acetoin utilization deacetylase AcuC-like enzyme